MRVIAYDVRSDTKTRGRLLGICPKIDIDYVTRRFNTSTVTNLMGGCEAAG